MASLGSRAASQLSFGQRVFQAFRSWYVHACGYRQLGLRRDDLIYDDDPDVEEALRRIPVEELDLRNFRIKRALDINLKQSVLPEHEWVTDATDKPYLDHVIEQVKNERKERELWDKQ